MPSKTLQSAGPRFLLPSLGLEAVELGRWIDTLPVDLLQALMSEAKARVYKKGEVLFRKGEVADGLYFIDVGEVSSSTVSEDGREYLLYLFESGSCVGLVSALDGGVSPSTCRAYSDSRVRLIERHVLQRLLEADPRYYQHLLALTLRWVRGLLGLLEDTALLGVRARFAKRLLQLAYIYGHADTDGVVIPFKLSQDEWGLFLGVTRQSVHQQLKDFRARGWISIVHDTVVLLDTEALAACIKSDIGGHAGEVGRGTPAGS